MAGDFVLMPGSSIVDNRRSSVTRATGVAQLSGILLFAATAVAADRIEPTIRHLSGLGSRVVGYPGCDRAAAFVESELRTMGLERVRREGFPVTVPMDKGGKLLIDGQEILLYGLWPNLVRTPTVPSEGLQAPMIYGGNGEWTDFDGKHIEGNIVLLEFNSEDRWLHAGALGARAIVFIAPESSTWLQAGEKHVGSPLDLPRYWIDRESGIALRRRLEQLGEIPATVFGRMDWEERQAWNILAEIEGTDPELRDELVVVQAYYDGASVVPALAPSAEATAGLAALLELGRHLKKHPPARSVILLATSAHFQDTQGIVAFLERHVRFHKKFVDRVPEPLPVKLFIGLDLSSGSDRLAIWNATHIETLRRFYASFGRRFTQYARDIAPSIGLDSDHALANGISPIRGLEWSNFVPHGMLTEARFTHKTGLVSLVFATVFDGRFRLDTPLDLPDFVDYENLQRQVALLLPMLSMALNDRALFTDLKRVGAVLTDRLRHDDRKQSVVLRDQLRDVRVEARGFPRKSQLPDQAIGEALVAVSWGSLGARPLKGVRKVRFFLTDKNGNLTAQGFEAGGGDLTVYRLDPTSGEVIMAPDFSERAKVYNGGFRPEGALEFTIRHRVNEKTVVLFPVIPRSIYGLINPRTVSTMRSLKAFDPAGRPARQYGYAFHGSSREGVGVVFGPRGAEPADRLKLIVDNGKMLLTNSQGAESEAQSRGIGYLLASESLDHAAWLGLRDMWQLTESRLRTMRRHAIENGRASLLHKRTAQLMDAAEDARDRQRWSEYVAHVRAAAGTEARAYPDALSTLNDVIKGLLFFLALVIPAAFFAERLLVAAADIRRQLLGFTLLLFLVWLIIAQIHPAFEIANPMIILLAFAIMAMSFFVLAMVIGRFNRYMRDYQLSAAKVHESDISRGSALYTAFMLGISNMRRRKLRTWLTFATLTLLSFTVLSFSSYRDRIQFYGFGLPGRGSYHGALIRDFAWSRLELTLLEFVRSHFGGRALISPRGWYIVQSAEGGATISVNHGDRSGLAGGLLGMSVVESELTGFDRALVAGTWFMRDDETSCLLPTELAAGLGISEDEVGTAVVQVFGRDFTVRGIVDEELVEQIFDLDGEIMTPVDFYIPEQDAGVAKAVSEEATDSEFLAFLNPRDHLPAQQVVYLPYRTLMDSGGELRSVALKFNEGSEGLSLVQAFLERVETTLFAGFPEPDSGEIRVYTYGSTGLTTIEGIGKLIIPMVIAAMIVLNTMLGAVYERSREIGIYSSVGLAPGHIAMLFVAEACVYAVLGITAGYVLGQGTGKLLFAAELTAGVNLNYSSLAAVISALIVMGVVLLSTIYPARLAAQAAVPDVVRRWKPPNADGDRWSFQFPFMVNRAEVVGICGFLHSYFSAYSEESLGTFYTEKTRIVGEASEKGEEFGLQMMIWLAPFDMGVSQYLQIAFVPTEVNSIYAIEIFIQRISGQDAFWKSTNHRFMNGLRKEFLIWHTLNPESKEQHRETAMNLLAREVPA